ncbi:3-keto-disaccharide hydrolase [Algisphaera agarilytica]|uniref:3-keto-alpha-glucoside-1,2-lyase/3-keto-2-hydroxy-glucal hydratase domain-containing protein n=1 Tax=Algisphaera agarilytica TaxID=1385975 RepID=A0A7X0LJT3_9BACT|nr:DUF1080 domain-containing protein [Algisphaera agarilytica]MBB6428926.1 hypothetical protein [Algisphaera agarilytica]
MKPWIIALGLLFCTASAAAEEGFYQYKHPGHPDNPLVPGMQWKVHDNDRPHAPRVIPGSYDEQAIMAPPSDAEILFDGTHLDAFNENKWFLKDGYVIAHWGGLQSKKAYGDMQMHLEWRTPNPPLTEKVGAMGNSGIYIMGLYELQIYDSYSSRIYADGAAGAMYGQWPPLVNASRPPGEWQTFDIYFTAPVFDGDQVIEPAKITVLHNGIFIHVDTVLTGPTSHRKPKAYEPHADRLPFYLQGGKNPVEFRNIWVRDLESP